MLLLSRLYLEGSFLVNQSLKVLLKIRKVDFNFSQLLVI